MQIFSFFLCSIHARNFFNNGQLVKFMYGIEMIKCFHLLIHAMQAEADDDIKIQKDNFI